MIPHPLVQAAVLGLVQGLTEFLPVSSSAHLLLVPALGGWPYLGKAFDVALHGGTLAALITYFRNDLRELARAAGLGPVLGLLPGPVSPEVRRLGLRLAVATLPAALLGFLFESWLETHFHEAAWVAFWLAAGAVAMLAVDRRPRTRSRWELTSAHSLWLGAAQALALIPGVSRSGATLTCARWLGLDLTDGARFAFLMGVPVLAGATLWKLARILWGGADWVDPAVLAVGMGSAALSGSVAIRVVMERLGRLGLAPFACYRVVLALALLAGLAWD